MKTDLKDQKIIGQLMDNAALAMDEERLSLFAIRALTDTERECTAAFADGQISDREAIRIYGKLQIVGASIQAQLDTDRKDIKLSRLLCKGVVDLATRKGKAALASGLRKRTEDIVAGSV